MNRARILYHLMRADYLERVRCHAFLVTLGLTVYFAYLAMPPRHAHYATLEIANRRGLYNSAWVGCLVALMTSAFLSLVGFYLIKNAIDRDRRTGVGQILAATPLAKWHYTLGKWASNLAVLGTMVATMAVCAVGMQLLRGEDRSIDPLAIVIPLAVVTLPAMAVTAGFAVLFEALPVLMGGLGNVAFFLVWAFGFTGPDLASAHHYRGIGSALGLSTILPSMMRSVQDAFGITAGPTSFNLGFNIDSAPRTLQTFPWAGMKWSADLLAGRLAWTLIGVGLALAAAIPFDRFDARSTNAGGRGRATSRPGGGEDTPRPVLGTVSDDISGAPGDPAAGSGPATPYAPASAAVLTAAKRSESALPLLLAELRLAVHGMPRAWFAVAGGLALACWFTPLSVARGWILPFAWIWPLLAWSALGGRESRHGTTALVFSAPRILTRQLPAVWLAGVVLALAMGLGVGLRLFLAGNVPGALAWGVGALFIPALALAAGVWSGGGKLFEVLYLLLWYAGPMNRTPFLDFIGTSDATTRSGATAGFAIAALGLLAIAALGRWRAVRT